MAAALVLLLSSGFAHAVTRPGSAPRTVENHPNTAAPAPSIAPAPVPSAPESALDVAPHPASIHLKNGELVVVADNSDLAGILKSVAQLGGMQVDGLGKSSRVFGTYGPGQPQDVLTQILNGSGYNFMMVGQSAEGMPLRLLLTEKTGSSLPASNAPAPAPQRTAQEEPPSGRARYGWAGGRPAASPGSPTPAGTPSPTPPPDLGPGAIYPQPPAENADREERVQQMMDRIRNIHEQQNQVNNSQQ